MWSDAGAGSTPQKMPKQEKWQGEDEEEEEETEGKMQSESRS